MLALLEADNPNKTKEEETYTAITNDGEDADDNWSLLFYVDEDDEAGDEDAAEVTDALLQTQPELVEELERLAPAVNRSLLLVLKILKDEYDDYEDVLPLIQDVAERLSDVQLRFGYFFAQLDEELTGKAFLEEGKAANSRGQMARLALAVERLSALSTDFILLNTE